MTRLLLASAALVAGLSGCASPAQEISFDPTTGTGVVAIPANTDVWPTYNKRAALALIRERVGPDFEIVKEDQIVTGQRTQNNQQVNGDPMLTGQTVTNTTTTSNVTEWWITYRRKAGPMTNPLSGMNGATVGQRPVGNVQQTHYMQGQSATGLQPAGGAIPSVQPGAGLVPAGGFPSQ
jgi:hypothetical protein